MIGPELRPVFVTHCLGCGKRLHAPNDASLRFRAAQHAKNCNALKKAPPMQAESSECSHQFDYGEDRKTVVCQGCGLELSEEQMAEALAGFYAEHPGEAH